MSPVQLAAFAVLAYSLFALWSLGLAWRERHQAAPWLLLTLASLVSVIWSVVCLRAAPEDFVSLEGVLLWVDALRQLAWLLWLAFLLGLLRSASPGRSALGLRLSILLVLGAVLLMLLATEWRWLPRAWQSQLPLYVGLVFAVLGLVLLEQLYRNVSDDARWNIKPLCLGLAAMYGFDLYLYTEALLLQRHDPEVMAMRPAVHALGLPLLLVGSLRGRKLGGRFALSRDAAFHSVALLLAGAYLMLVAALGYWLRFTGGDWGPALQLLLLAAAAVLLAAVLMSGAMRARLRVWLGKHFLRYRYDYRQEWLRFTAVLSDPSTAGDPGGAVLRALADLVESRGGGLWRSDGGSQVQVAHWNFERRQFSLAGDSPFIAEMAASPWIIDLNAERSGARREQLPDWLIDDGDAWLVIPLHAAGALQGWVVLTQPRAPVPLDWEVLDLLRTAASQAAAFLAMLRASDELMEARKFEAFNRMSAFVVHDLKNIVTQLALMLKNAERHGDNPEFRQDMLETVDHAVEKMRQLMTQLREGDRPVGVASGVPLQGIAERLRSAAAQRGRRLELQIDEALATRGHPERIERVIGHAVQNAFDASAEHQPVRLTLSRHGSSAKLQVIDEGCGMTAEFISERLFKPFQSTKSQGMGIGAYESLQYMQELGGKMDVQSEPGRGTCVTFLLPLFHLQSTGATALAADSR